MKNAHLRFGWLTYFKRTEKTTTTFRLRMDRFIGEVEPDLTLVLQRWQSSPCVVYLLSFPRSVSRWRLCAPWHSIGCGYS
jgi:hypothetical protein